MKKVLAFIVGVIFTFFSVWAQNIKEVEDIKISRMETKFPEYDQSFEIGKTQDSYVIWNFNRGIKIYNESLYIDQDGFSAFDYRELKNTVLFGSNFFFIFDSVLWSTIQIEKISNMNEYTDYLNEINKDASMQSYFDLHTFGIKRISSSSEYSEILKSGKVSYSSDYLNSFLISQIDNSKLVLHNPWVPGKDKNSSGIGEYLEIEFDTLKDNLVILNGYVDFEKRYLYKANNRVKKVTITSLDEDKPFLIEYEFEDFVHFSEINFPCAVDKVRFTIDEVYKGEKWDDTCIQAVITRWD